MPTAILIIEDDEEFREVLAELLTLHGFAVTTADCGTKGLDCVNRQMPDLIICDIIMPEMDGYEVLHRLRENERTRNIPFIFSTVKSEHSDRQEAERNQVSNYLIKPYDEAELLDCIKSCLQSYSNDKRFI